MGVPGTPGRNNATETYQMVIVSSNMTKTTEWIIMLGASVFVRESNSLRLIMTAMIRITVIHEPTPRRRATRSTTETRPVCRQRLWR